MQYNSSETVYNGIFKLDSPSENGAPNEKDLQDFSFIRVKLDKNFLGFHKYENWRPISFPRGFTLPKDPRGELRNYDQSPRFFKISFKANLGEYASIGQMFLLLRMRKVEITRIISITEIDEKDKINFRHD